MRRRRILAGLLLTLAAPLAAEAQPAGKVPRIGVLAPTSPPAIDRALTRRLPAGLRELGYVEGQNIIIEYRWAEGQARALPALAAELVRLERGCHCGVDGTPASLAAKKATSRSRRHGDGGRSRGSGPRREPRAARREHHRPDMIAGRDERQAAGTAQGGGPEPLARRRALESGAIRCTAVAPEGEEARPGRLGCKCSPWRSRARRIRGAPSATMSARAALGLVV